MKKTTITIISKVKEFLKKLLISELSKKLFGIVLGGFKGYLFTFAVSKYIWPYTEQILNTFAVKGFLVIDKAKGVIYAKRIDTARANNDGVAYDDVIDKL